MKWLFKWYTYAPRWVVLALVYLHGMSNEAVAQQPPLDESVVKRWREYEGFSHSLQGTIRITDTFVSGKTSNQTVHLKKNRECVVRRHFHDGDSYETVQLVNPVYSAELRKDAVDPSKVILVRFKQDQNAPVGSSGEPSLAGDAFVEGSPHFSYWRTRLSDLVSNPSFQIKKTTTESRDGQEFARIDYSCVFDEPQQRIRRQGSIYFDPSRCWCIRQVKEAEVIFHDGVLHRTMDWDIQYKTIDHQFGFPLIQSLSMKWDGTYEKDKRKSAGTLTAECEWQVNDRLPDSEFTLSAFGLPEPVGVSWKKPIPTYVWILGAAAACGALAVLFRYLARRRLRVSRPQGA